MLKRKHDFFTKKKFKSEAHFELKTKKKRSTKTKTLFKDFGIISL